MESDIDMCHGKEEMFLEDSVIAKEPISQFKAWFDEASQIPEIVEANLMGIATASKDGYPSARYVLLKGFGKDGFKFFSNYESRKAQDLEENPKAALLFYWEPLRRSIRIEGRVEKSPTAESVECFKSKPRDSQIGSAVSHQSRVIESRAVLLQKEEQFKQLYEGRPIPRPDHWGGYIVIPETIEFWSGKTNRFHDRIAFRKKTKGEVVNNVTTHDGDDGWVYERLSP